MKPTLLPLLTLALAVSASAFAITPGTSASVTLGLIATVETGGFKIVTNGETAYEYEKLSSKTNAAGDILSETTEYKSTTLSGRYGNGQLLDDLNDENLLDGTISGWNILAISRVSDGLSGDDEGNGPALLYAVKKGKTPVLIDFSIGKIASVESASSKYTQDYVKERETYTASSSSKTVINLELSDFAVVGVMSGTYKYVSGSLGKGEAAVPYRAFVDGARKVPAFGGTYYGSSIADGTLSISAAKVVDLETLGFGATTFDGVTINGGSTSGSSSYEGSSSSWGGVTDVVVDVGFTVTTVSPN